LRHQWSYCQRVATHTQLLQLLSTFPERAQREYITHNLSADALRALAQNTRRIKVAGVAASTAATVTGAVASVIGAASYSVAVSVASALSGSKKSGKRDNKKFKRVCKACQKGCCAGGPQCADYVENAPADVVTPEQRSALKVVGAAGLLAYVEVYDALENAARTVLMQSGDQCQQFVEYKYGREAGDAAKSSLPVMQDMVMAGVNFTRLGARAIVSHTAKKTASLYLKDALAGLSVADAAKGHRVPPEFEAVRT